MIMKQCELDKIARKCLKDGPAITKDANGYEYFAYIAFIRSGYKWCIATVDVDLADIQPDKLNFIKSELRDFYEPMLGQ
jgi:hypothetical protein